MGFESTDYDYTVFRITSEISKQVFPITLDIDNPVFRAGFDRLLAIQTGITAAKKRGGLVGRLQQAGWAARGLATFARLYFVPVVHNELPSNARAVAAW
jgi:magnesium-protoporphyrin IX monomethyl ester (oxidative) cyclase